MVLGRWRAGDEAARERVMALVYGETRRSAAAVSGGARPRSRVLLIVRHLAQRLADESVYFDAIRAGTLPGLGMPSGVRKVMP